MRPPKDTEKLIRQTELRTNAHADRAVLNDCLKAMEDSRKHPASQPSIWRTIMTNKSIRLAAAAVIIIAAMIGIYWVNGTVDITSKVYGMPDIPALLKRAKTAHIESWVFMPKQGKPGDSESVKLKMEIWFDIESGCYRSYKPTSIDKTTGEPRYVTTISDGQYLMTESYRLPVNGQPSRHVRFTELTPFQARLGARRGGYESLVRMIGNTHQMQGAKKVGQRLIDSTLYDVWENEFCSPDGRATRIETCINPDTGHVESLFFWLKTSSDAADWIPVMDLHTIEFDITPPRGIFDTVPPAGYVLDNTKDTADSSFLGLRHGRALIEEYELRLHIGFTLADGSVLIAYSCPQKNVDQQNVFATLRRGGPLPELPAVIPQITTIPSNRSYLGYHFTYTRKGALFYEWALYIPDTEPTTRDLILGYTLDVDYRADKSDFGSLPGGLFDDFEVASVEDFNTWVVGAMAELSDDAVPPEGITYDGVLELATELRTRVKH